MINRDGRTEPLVPIEGVGEHSPEKDDHLETLRIADEALAKAEREIREGRERLQNAMDRYKERSGG